MINSCPDLTALDLNLYLTSDMQSPDWKNWLLDHYISQWNSLTSLRELKLAGLVEVDWTDLLYNRPQHQSLHSLFQRNDFIHTLRLDWLHVYQNSVAWCTALVESLFPSLRCLAGPADLCITVAKSRVIAPRLEVLEITAEFDRRKRGGGDVFELLAAFSMPMPALVKLLYKVEGSEPSILKMRELGQFLAMAPGLDTIVIQHYMQYPVRTEFLSIVTTPT
ncbi:hypothetical protein RhiJN_06085 [Ceratobasidium sp. AG-Ba]|nr:hypothetical protein RhiJN_06085 [Ceratobasidium sp. AG-Ba]QRW07036.1 hypothetical protein RhiLY_06035 [Ceratobasidium sp. AG-Ba]